MTITELYDSRLDEQGAINQRASRMTRVLLCGSLEGCGATLVEMADGKRQLLSGAVAASMVQQIFEQQVPIEAGRCLEHGPSGGYNAITA